MKVTIPQIYVESLHALALAIWLGAQVSMVILCSVGLSSAPHLFLVRDQAVVDTAAIVMVGIQYLTRNRLKKYRTLSIADGIRHLLTFLALIFAEYLKFGAGGKAAPVAASQTTTLLTSLAQIVLLAAISAITIWLLAAAPAAAPAAATAGAPPAQAQDAPVRAKPAVQPAQAPRKKKR